MKKNVNMYVKLGLSAVLLIVVLIFIYNRTRPETQEGMKKITIVVTDRDGETEEFQLITDREYLGDLLRDTALASGEEGPYGMYITEVNGYQADDSAQEWWCITKGYEILMSNADETVLEDGDQFELTLKTGYEE